MRLTWGDAEDIAGRLLAIHPGLEPLGVRFTDLHRMVVALPDFDDDPNSSTEGSLERIQMAWVELRQG